MLDFSSSVHSSKLIQAIIELICNEDTSQVQHFPYEKEQPRHGLRYFHYPVDSDSDDDDKHDKTKLWFLKSIITTALHTMIFNNLS